MRIYPVILCGGSGTRLWPASRPSRPKQFIPLIGERSLFQNTAARLQGVAGAQDPIVVAGAGHVGSIESQLAELGLSGVVIVEPEGRDSAPAIAAAAYWIAARDPDGIAVVVASDHHIPDIAAFCDSVAIAAKAATQGRLVTFGVRPTGPVTAYGYIQPGEALEGFPGVFSLGRFVEKPNVSTAQAYVDAGYLWNSGNFVFKAQTLIEELQHHAPDVALTVAMAMAEGQNGARDRSGVFRLGESFRGASKISIDYAVMEKTNRAAVAPVDFAWSDLGAWDAVWSASDQDQDGNAVSGEALLLNSRDCLVRAPGERLVVGIGLRRLAIVADAEAILICDLDSSQGVKAAVDRLAAKITSLNSPAGLASGSAPGAGSGGARAEPPPLPALREKLENWLYASALPVWWSLGADHLGGGFHEALGETARPVLGQRRARVQARQIYSYATAGALGWPGPWKQAVEHGLNYFYENYRRRDGLFRTLVTPDGAPADETVMLYDQAFALLAMATAAKSLPDLAPVLSQDAARLLGELNRTRRADRGFTEPVGLTPYQANPHMHLFEAALAWESASSDTAWANLADELGQLCLSAFVDPSSGGLREHFDSAWNPAAGPAGRLIEPGHQFEWAWLLERWGKARGRDDAKKAARRLFDVGVRGIDPVRGVAMNGLLDDFTPQDTAARLWPQTEWLKASLILGDEANARAAASAVSRYLCGVSPGLWRDRLDPAGEFVREPAPASSLYHIVAAIKELSVRSGSRPA